MDSQIPLELPPQPDVPLLEPPKRKSSLPYVIIILILCIIAVFLFMQNTSVKTDVVEQSPTPTVTISPQPTPTTDPLETYMNSELGISFRYPRQWTLADKPPRVVSFQTDVPTGLEVPDPQFSEFFVMHHTDIDDLDKWLKSNNAGKITGSKVIGEHTFTIVKGGTHFVDREYILRITDDEYIRFVIEPVMKSGEGYDTTELLFDLILTTLRFTDAVAHLSIEEAVKIVSTLPEVNEYLKNVSNGKVVFDHEDAISNSWVIHVYEELDDHLATKNWYNVNKLNGTIIPEF